MRKTRKRNMNMKFWKKNPKKQRRKGMPMSNQERLLVLEMKHTRLIVRSMKQREEAARLINERKHDREYVR
jgi:hypothetical protein